MTLFESDSQYRERATLWRIFSLLPLFANLSLGKMWRWFAVNVPMDLGTGGSFTSDVDILAKLSNMPKENSWSYYAWEVKVSLLHNDGSASSLKAGKTKRTVTQLEAYRDFGIPVVSLLDVQICELCKSSIVKLVALSNLSICECLLSVQIVEMICIIKDNAKNPAHPTADVVGDQLRSSERSTDEQERVMSNIRFSALRAIEPSFEDTIAHFIDGLKGNIQCHTRA